MGPLVVHLARWRMEEAIASETQRLGRGLWILSASSTVIALFGFLGAAFGIMGAFRGGSGTKESLLRALIENLCAGLEPILWGLLFAIPIYWVERVLREKLETFRIEMENAASEVLTWIASRARGPA